MKHDWEYKPLGEVCDIINGKNQRQVECPTGKYPIMGSGGVMGYASDYLCEAGTTIIGRKGTINRPIYVNQRFWNVDTAFGIQPKLDVEPKFVYYLCKSIDFKKYDKSVTIPSLVKSDLLKIPIPVPPLQVQKQICSLLDKLSRVIEAKKEQLKELDNLAQAIFYDMFGDPTVNDNGWVIKPFNTLCSNMTKGPFGSDIKKKLFVPKSSDTYKVYIQVNAIQKDENLGDYYISKDYFDNKMSRFEVKPRDYIITCDGTMGKYIRLSESMERGIISASLLRITLNDSISYRYFESLWDNYILYKLKSQARNAALIHLPSAKKIGEELVPVPPLPLQQSFAEKVEAIERQKELINQSIREVQTLFDSRMDYLFSD